MPPPPPPRAFRRRRPPTRRSSTGTEGRRATARSTTVFPKNSPPPVSRPGRRPPQRMRRLRPPRLPSSARPTAITPLSANGVRRPTRGPTPAWRSSPRTPCFSSPRITVKTATIAAASDLFTACRLSRLRVWLDLPVLPGMTMQTTVTLAQARVQKLARKTGCAPPRARWSITPTASGMDTGPSPVDS
jgi:hypothetical protein